MHTWILSVPQVKAVKLSAAALAALTSFSLTELTTGQAALAALFAFLSAALAAWLASRPALLQARNAAKQLRDTEAAQTHAEHVAFLESRIEYSSRALFLTRVSKHNLISYSQELTAQIAILCHTLKKAGVDPPAFTFKSYDELCGAEDRALAQLTLPAEVVNK